MTADLSPEHVAFVGFGEAATAFLAGWGAKRPSHVTAFDTKIEKHDTRDEMLARYSALGAQGATGIDGALSNASVVFSAVTSDQALVAAVAAAPYLSKRALWLDCNSCAPDTKRRAAQAIESAGARYVDVAVMAPVYPKLHKVPLLVSGPHADAAATVLSALDMRPQIAGAHVGDASSIKMIRSIMIKGLEALTAECLLAARRAGVESQVIDSLEGSDPDIAWRRRATYNLERMMVHGVRRAAEMREVAATVEALGLPHHMSAATANWQDALGARKPDPGDDDLFQRLDRALAAL